MFTVTKNLIVLSLERQEDFVVLKANGEEIAYFDETGMNLLPACTSVSNLPVDDGGYLKVRKA